MACSHGWLVIPGSDGFCGVLRLNSVGVSLIELFEPADLARRAAEGDHYNSGSRHDKLFSRYFLFTSSSNKRQQKRNLILTGFHQFHPNTNHLCKGAVCPTPV